MRRTDQEVNVLKITVARFFRTKDAYRGADYDPNLPYGPKVYVARRKKPDPWWVTAIEVSVVVGVLLFFVYMYYYMDHLHFHVLNAYANVGVSHAQHHVAHKYLNGHGVNKDEKMAFYWFREATKNGHGHGAYNLVAGHLQGYETDVEEHEVEPLLKMAADKDTHDLEDSCLAKICNIFRT
ncbi:hypothetical protein ACROYT_G013716 [Oculina patagonica]